MTGRLGAGRGGVAAEVAAWRRDRLRAAGVPPPLARALARDARVDLHALIGLVERGCPPALAARILAPLEGPGDAGPSGASGA